MSCWIYNACTKMTRDGIYSGPTQLRIDGCGEHPMAFRMSSADANPDYCKLVVQLAIPNLLRASREPFIRRLLRVNVRLY